MEHILTQNIYLLFKWFEVFNTNVRAVNLLTWPKFDKIVNVFFHK